MMFLVVKASGVPNFPFRHLWPPLKAGLFLLLTRRLGHISKLFPLLGESFQDERKDINDSIEVHSIRCESIEGVGSYTEP